MTVPQVRLLILGVLYRATAWQIIGKYVGRVCCFLGWSLVVTPRARSGSGAKGAQPTFARTCRPTILG